MNWVHNLDEIASNDQRKNALSIASAGLDAIDTEVVVKSALSIVPGPDGEILRVKDASFPLLHFKSIRIIGFGKVVCEAAAALEAILGDRIKSGIVIGTEAAVCSRVEGYAGSHPMPSRMNVRHSSEIVTLSKSLVEDDLVIVIVSGGGSSLFCWPQEECDQGARLYAEFLKTGGTIEELNTVRKHLSAIKGGGLAKMLHPATVIGLVFSDVPGCDTMADVASGPTFRDPTTIADAENILKKYGLSGYTLNETPKENMFFERVHNTLLVSNRTALDAMALRGRELGYTATIVSDTMYDPPAQVVRTLFAAAQTLPQAKKLILAGGEPDIRVPDKHGKGGRNVHAALEALVYMDKKAPDQSPQNQESQPSSASGALFISLASDGHDNNRAAGAIADAATLDKMHRASLDPSTYIAGFDAYSFFEKTGDLIITGQTEANVSDLMLLLQG